VGATLAIGIAVLFVAVVSSFVTRGVLPLGILILYVFASLVTALAYAVDKSAARNGRWRTAESTLHVMAVLGGWPGALVAQKVFHHKGRKASFQIAFLATVALNCCVLLWFLWMRGL
jgi:uncharacterized membrane protein YsdA (DUF1294 family)